MKLFVVPLLAITLLLGGCSGNPAEPPLTNPYFPVLKEPETTYPDALAEGTLVLEDNCLRLKPHSLIGESSLLIWPYGYTLNINGDEIHVVDNKDQVVASLGDSIKVGGGHIILEIVEKYIGKSLPDNCPGPYWLVSGVIKD
jgi:hypothetical protein